MAIAANDAADRVEQLVILTERLTELIAQQAQAFEERRPQDAAALLEETSRLANLYRHESARVRADQGLVQGAPLAARTRLVRATEAFDAVLARQGRSHGHRGPGEVHRRRSGRPAHQGRGLRRHRRADHQRRRHGHYPQPPRLAGRPRVCEPPAWGFACS